MENNSVVGTLRNIPSSSSPGLTEAAATALHRQEFHFLLVSTDRTDNGKNTHVGLNKLGFYPKIHLYGTGGIFS